MMLSSKSIARYTAREKEAKSIGPGAGLSGKTAACGFESSAGRSYGRDQDGVSGLGMSCS
jgi:hypothetical protein